MIDKSYFGYRCIFLLFSIFLVATLFLPTFTMEKYVEYEFNYGYKTTEYQAYYEPYASKITSFDIISSLWTKKIDIRTRTRTSNIFKTDQYQKLKEGLITQEEYQESVANHRETNKLLVERIAIGDGDLSRFQSQLQTYAIICIIFYFIYFVFFIINLLNMFLSSRMLFMANYQSTWLLIGMSIVNIILIFSFSLSSTESLIFGQVVEITTICGAPSTLLYVMTLSCIAYLFISKVVCRKFLDFSYFDDETTNKSRRFRKSHYSRIEEYLTENGYKDKRF